MVNLAVQSVLWCGWTSMAHMGRCVLQKQLHSFFRVGKYPL